MRTIPNFVEPEGIDVRFTLMQDKVYLEKFFEEDGITKWFPADGEREVAISIDRWMQYTKLYSSLTSTINGEVCGFATIWLNSYKKLLHQAQFGIIVGEKFRGKNVGSTLLKNLIHLAKIRFNISLLHLEVYEGNPAIKLYEKFGFKKFGYQEKWIFDKGEYLARIFMEKDISEVNYGGA